MFVNMATYNSVDEMLQWKRDLVLHVAGTLRWGGEIDLMTAALCFNLNMYTTTRRVW